MGRNSVNWGPAKQQRVYVPKSLALRSIGRGGKKWSAMRIVPHEGMEKDEIWDETAGAWSLVEPETNLQEGEKVGSARSQCRRDHEEGAS